MSILPRAKTTPFACSMTIRLVSAWLSCSLTRWVSMVARWCMTLMVARSAKARATRTSASSIGVWSTLARFRAPMVMSRSRNGSANTDWKPAASATVAKRGQRPSSARRFSCSTRSPVRKASRHGPSSACSSNISSTRIVSDDDATSRSSPLVEASITPAAATPSTCTHRSVRTGQEVDDVVVGDERVGQVDEGLDNVSFSCHLDPSSLLSLRPFLSSVRIGIGREAHGGATAFRGRCWSGRRCGHQNSSLRDTTSSATSRSCRSWLKAYARSWMSASVTLIRSCTDTAPAALCTM